MVSNGILIFFAVKYKSGHDKDAHKEEGVANKSRKPELVIAVVSVLYNTKSL